MQQLTQRCSDNPLCVAVGLNLLLLGSLQLPAAPAAQVSPGIRHWPQTLAIPSPSVSCQHKCQAPPVSHSSTLSISPSNHPPHLSRFSKFHKCHFIMRLSSLWRPPRPYRPPQPLRLSPSALSFSFLFHLCSISLLLSRAILRESFPLFLQLRNHTIGLATSVCFSFFFSSPPPQDLGN